MSVEQEIALITCTRDTLRGTIDVVHVNDGARLLFAFPENRDFPISSGSLAEASSRPDLLKNLLETCTDVSIPSWSEIRDPGTGNTYSIQILPVPESTSLMISIRDITERDSCELLHRALVASEYDFIGVADPSGVITEILTDRTGIVRAEGESSVGKTLSEVYGSEVSELLLTLMDTVAAQHGPSSISYHSPVPDDLRRYRITCSEYRRTDRMEFLFAVRNITTDTNISMPFHDTLFQGHIFHTPEGIIQRLSDGLLDALGLSAHEVTGRPVTSILPTFRHDGGCESIINTRHETGMKVHCYTSPADAEGGMEVTSLYNTGELEKSQRILERKISFENLLFDLTGSILRSTEETLDADIDRALELLGRFSGADRSYVFLYREDETMDNTHEWVADGITREKDNLQQLPKHIFPNLVKDLEEGKDRYFREVEQMGPQYVAEREILLAQSVKSIQFVPLLVHDKSFGFMGFDAVRSNMEWSTEERQLLRYFANNLSEVLARNAYTRELVRLRIEAESYALEKEHSHRDLSDFLARLSHEIRNSIHSILGMTDMLLETNMTNHQKRYTEIIRSGSTFLIDLVKDFLDFSTYSRVDGNTHETEFSLKKLISRIGEEHLQEIQRKGLYLSTDIDNRVPSLVSGDSVQITQILKNLIGNAIKFTDDGGITIRASSEKSDGRVFQLNLSVSDTGVGIAQEHVQKVFTPFYSTARDSSGIQHSSGLGLPIVKSIIDNLGGAISVSSALGEGSTFTVSLPLTIVRKSTGSDTLEPSWRGARAIVIDPDERVASISARTLSSLSFNTDVITSSDELNRFLFRVPEEGHPYAICFIDISMVDEDMLQILSICKEMGQYPYQQMILTSSRSESFADLDHSYALFDNTFTIPLDARKVIAQINTHGGTLAQDRPFDYISYASLSSLHVLIVEDLEINQEVLTYMLDKVGSSHSVVNDGYEALNAVRNERIDLILLDIRMPGMDGYETARAIHALDDGTYRDLPIIAVTANSSPSERDRCMNAGMSEYIEKPIAKETLYDILRAYIPDAVRKQGRHAVSDEIRVSGFNVRKGLALLHNNRDVYLSLMRKFYSMYASFSSLYGATAQNRKERIRFVHSVKSIAASLGAEELTHRASTFEMMLNSGITQDETRTEKRFLATLEAALQAVEASCFVTEAPETDTGRKVEVSEVVSLLNALRTACLAADVLEVRQAFNTLAGYPFTGTASDLFLEITSLISSYNFTEVEPRILSLLEHFGSTGEKP